MHKPLTAEQARAIAALLLSLTAPEASKQRSK